MFSTFGAILETREPVKRAEISHPIHPGASAQNASRGLECRLPAALPPLDLSIISSGKYGLKSFSGGISWRFIPLLRVGCILVPVMPLICLG